MKRNSHEDFGRMYAEHAWPRWASLVESCYPAKGDLTLAQLWTLFPRFSSRRAEQWEIRRSIMHSHDFPACVSLRQLRRLAAAGKIPGAYPLKRGHYRVRRCRALYRWLAAGGMSPRPSVAERMLMKRDKYLVQVIALATKSGPNAMADCEAEADKRVKPLDKDCASNSFFEDTSDSDELPAQRKSVSLWKAPLPQLASECLGRSKKIGARDTTRTWWASLAERIAALIETQDGISKQDESKLRFAVVFGELLARDEPITMTKVSQFLGVSRATFYRKGYAAEYRRFLTSPVAEPLHKDTRASRHYKSQVLQETDVE